MKPALESCLSEQELPLFRCDDGKDPLKRAWIHSKGPEFVYISGRKRAKGEMNGKSGNVNNICNQLYPDRLAIPGNEVLCIFDADQVGAAPLVSCRYLLLMKPFPCSQILPNLLPYEIGIL